MKDTVKTLMIVAGVGFRYACDVAYCMDWG